MREELFFLRRCGRLVDDGCGRVIAEGSEGAERIVESFETDGSLACAAGGARVSCRGGFDGGGGRGGIKGCRDFRFD